MATVGGEDRPIHLPSLPPGYEVAIEECHVVSSVNNNGVMTSGQTTANTVRTSPDGFERRGHQEAKPPSIVVSETEESRAVNVLRESRWLMEDNLTTEAAESLLRACGSDGSFIISNTSFPNIYRLYCRRLSGDGTVDEIEQINIERSPTGMFFWSGQGEFENLASVAARFLHLNPHKHCPMFANRSVWSDFSGRFVGDESSGFQLSRNHSRPDVSVALHNTINQNEWFFPALSEEQAAYMLNQHGESNSFIVSNQMSTENYIMSTRQAIPGLDQDIIEHLRITKLMDSVFQMAGDENFHQHLDAVVKAYRQANPNMKALFERPMSRRTSQVQGSSQLDMSLDDEVQAPPEYTEASMIPNPDDLNRLPTVPRLTLSDGSRDQTSVAEHTDTPVNTQTTRDGGSRGSGKCCVIL